MPQLPQKMTLGLGHEETPASFASRTAHWNGRSARDFCLDMGFQFQQVIDGHPEALERLAHLTRADLGSLTASAFTRIQDRSYSFRGERILRTGLVRSRVRVCPKCIAEDAGDDHRSQHVLGYQRSSWLLTSICTCPVHRQALVEISNDLKPNSLHDFAVAMKEGADRLASVDVESGVRDPSPLERYVLGRLRGGIRGGNWLDEMRLDAAARTSEILGACATHGVNVRLRDLSEDDLFEAGSKGFEIAAQGQTGIRAFLTELQEQQDPASLSKGPKRAFFRLYEWLAHESADPAYNPLRQLVRDHCIETMPLGPGDELFGESVAVRSLHSVHTASKEYQTHPKRLRKLLHLGGFLDEKYADAYNDHALFDAKAAHSFIVKAAASLPLTEAARYLNIPRPYDVDILTRYVSPLVNATRNSPAQYSFEPKSLDTFLRDLTADAPEIGPDENGLVGLIEARKKACCSMAEVVDLLLAKELKTVRVHPEKRGFLSILVSTDEVRKLVRLQDHSGLSLRQAEKTLSVNTKVLKALITNGYLAAEEAINPENRCPQTIIAPEEITRFKASYVSLIVLSREVGIHFNNLKKKLTDIPLAMDREKIGGSFYLRSSLPPLS